MIIMNELGMMILTLIAGFLLGAFFFGGLWWTTRKGLLSRTPALWFLGSLFLRMGITITAFYFISRGHWERTVICLLGFIIARFIIMRYTQVPEINKNQ
jgi:F1F0 ATPase subunit 2